MKYGIDFDAVPDCCVVTSIGIADSAAFGLAMADMLGSPRWRRGLSVILDHRQLQEQELTADDMLTIERHYDDAGRPLADSLFAIVVGDDTRARATATRFCTRMRSAGQHRDSRVFDSLAAATAWLAEYPAADGPGRG